MNVFKMLHGFEMSNYKGVTVARKDYFQYFVYMHRICPAEQGPFCVKASFESQ